VVVWLKCRVWFENAYMYWLYKEWVKLSDRHGLLALLLAPLVSVTFIVTTGLLLLVDSAVELARRAVRMSRRAGDMF
jgi:hypothetical protein